jgi:hypothetical protein
LCLHVGQESQRGHRMPFVLFGGPLISNYLGIRLRSVGGAVSIRPTKRIARLWCQRSVAPARGARISEGGIGCPFWWAQRSKVERRLTFRTRYACLFDRMALREKCVGGLHSQTLTSEAALGPRKQACYAFQACMRPALRNELAYIELRQIELAQRRRTNKLKSVCFVWQQSRKCALPVSSFFYAPGQGLPGQSLLVKRTCWAGWSLMVNLGCRRCRRSRSARAPRARATVLPSVHVSSAPLTVKLQELAAESATSTGRSQA